MAVTNFTEAFGRFGATLANPNWAVSAKASDNSIVISCWFHHLHRVPGTKRYRYTDQLSRFRGNASGTNLLRNHSLEALTKGTTFKLIVVRVLDESDVERVERGEGADKVKKTFAAKPEFTGHLESFDNDEFQIIFNGY